MTESKRSFNLSICLSLAVFSVIFLIAIPTTGYIIFKPLSTALLIKDINDIKDIKGTEFNVTFGLLSYKFENGTDTKWDNSSPITCHYSGMFYISGFVTSIASFIGILIMSIKDSFYNSYRFDLTRIRRDKRILNMFLFLLFATSILYIITTLCWGFGCHKTFINYVTSDLIPDSILIDTKFTELFYLISLSVIVYLIIIFILTKLKTANTYNKLSINSNNSELEASLNFLEAP